MKKNVFLLAAFAFVALLLSSCLTVEKKSYQWEFTGDNSGTLTITYMNIMSDMDDSLDVRAEDFQELLDSYVNGTYIEEQFPMAKLVSKELFVKNDQLWGEVVIEFDDLKAVHLYRHDNDGPFMFCVNTAPDTESYLESNGEYGGDHMPVVFWSKKTDVLELKTLIQEVDESMLSLVDEYYNWKQ